MKKILTAVFAAGAAMLYSTVWAWQPEKPITVLIGFGPGSGNEVSFRAMAAQVEQATGAKFVVTTRPGADSVLSLNELVRAAPDGHTINIASQQNTWVMADVTARDVRQFTPDSFSYTVNIAKSPLAIIAPVSSPVNTPADLVRLLETTDRQINIAVGSSSHKLAYQYLVERTKARRDLVQAISYKGPAQAGSDVAGRHVDFGIIPAAIADSLVKSGLVKFIGLCSEQRLAKIPSVPLMDSVVPGLHVYAGWGILLPSGVTPEVTNWYVEHFVKAIRSEQSRRFFEDNLMFMDERELTPEGYRSSMMRLRKTWLPIAQSMDFSSTK
jgi:tripartite-type tricarboxylate transporter receptor subunit TctC